MSGLHNLVDKINNKIIHKKTKKSPYGLNLNPSFNTCSHEELLEGHIYIFLPVTDLQTKVKKEIQKYAKQNNFHFIVTTQEHCENDWECHGHYVDPFGVSLNNNHVFVDLFPENINGTFTHLLNNKNYKIFKEIKRP